MQVRRMLEVETPEAVAVRYPLASYGSRGTAAIIDVSLIFLAIAVEILAGALLLYAIADIAPLVVEFVATWVLAFMIALAFLTFWGYYLIGEIFGQGRTLGKRWMRIRVVRDDGSRIGAMDGVIRNILRLVDILPSLYGIGIISMTVSSDAKRLGDYAAGTVVIDEPARKELTLGGPYDDERTELVRDYLRRRDTLTWEARYQVGVAVLATYGEEPGMWDEPTIAGRLADLADLRSEIE
jgi:uncharacterized RDD family membrane protein YckC